MSGRVPLTLACWDYDRTSALANGDIRPDGVDLTYLSLPVEETFFRMLRYREFDAAEMSLSSYVISLLDDGPFIAIPAFTSRAFRHNGIYVNAASGIAEPGDLPGRVVGLAEYQLTANVWIRGILAEHYGVPMESVTYFTGGEEEPGRDEKLALDLPPSIRVERIGAGKTLSAMLASGEIDALYTARMPSTYGDGRGRVRRLLPDYPAVEREYYKQTGIFPIMHTIAIRTDVYERHRWIAQALAKAFAEAQRRTYADLDVTAALKAMLPWLTSHVEDARALMGEDFWPYGLTAANRTTLATFLRYHHEQGLSPRLLAPEALFAPETLESFVI